MLKLTPVSLMMSIRTFCMSAVSAQEWCMTFLGDFSSLPVIKIAIEIFSLICTFFASTFFHFFTFQRENSTFSGWKHTYTGATSKRLLCKSAFSIFAPQLHVTVFLAIDALVG